MFSGFRKRKAEDAPDELNQMRSRMRTHTFSDPRGTLEKTKNALSVRSIAYLNRDQYINPKHPADAQSMDVRLGRETNFSIVTADIICAFIRKRSPSEVQRTLESRVPDAALGLVHVSVGVAWTFLSSEYAKNLWAAATSSSTGYADAQPLVTDTGLIWGPQLAYKGLSRLYSMGRDTATPLISERSRKLRKLTAACDNMYDVLLNGITVPRGVKGDTIEIKRAIWMDHVVDTTYRSSAERYSLIVNRLQELAAQRDPLPGDSDAFVNDWMNNLVNIPHSDAEVGLILGTAFLMIRNPDKISRVGRALLTAFDNLLNPEQHQDEDQEEDEDEDDDEDNNFRKQFYALLLQNVIKSCYVILILAHLSNDTQTVDLFDDILNDYKSKSASQVALEQLEAELGYDIPIIISGPRGQALGQS